MNAETLPEQTTAGNTSGRRPRSQESKREITKRRLPHWTLDGSTYFVTFRIDRGAGLLSIAERCSVLNHIRKSAPDFDDLAAAVVMPDHVHLLLRPRDGVGLSRITRGIKGVTARMINQNRGTR